MNRFLLNFILALVLLTAGLRGSTIQIPAGTYNGYNFVGGNTYVGAGEGKVIINVSPDGEGIGWKLHNADNFGLSGVTINGGGFYFDKDGNGARNTNIAFDNVAITSRNGGESGNCVTFTSGLNNGKFTNCTFTSNIFGIYGYNYSGLIIANCEFLNCGGGFHIDAFGNCGGFLAEQNYFEGNRGMNAECQGEAVGFIFQDNFMQKPNLSTDFHSNDTSMAFSLILAKSRTIRVQRNTVISLERPDRVGIRNAFEAGGDDAIYEDNLVIGTNVWLACNDGDGTHSVIVRNNRVSQFLGGDGESFPRPGSSYVSTNNGPNVQLTWNPGRGRPYPNKRFGDFQVESLPKTLSATATIQPALGPDGGGVASVTFTNAPSGITQIKYSGVAAGNPSDPRGIVAEKIIPYASMIAVPSLPPGYRTRLVLTLLNAAGVSVNSCTCDTAEAPGSSTSPWPVVTPTQPTDDPATVAALKAQVSELKARIAAGMKALQP